MCELAGGIAAYVLRGQVESIINTNMKASLDNYNVTGYGGVTQTWDIMQVLSRLWFLPQRELLFFLEVELTRTVAHSRLVGGVGAIFVVSTALKRHWLGLLKRVRYRGSTNCCFSTTWMCSLSINGSTRQTFVLFLVK